MEHGQFQRYEHHRRGRQAPEGPREGADVVLRHVRRC